ncbi:hypothetical protein GCM10010981_44010 [Dyella nitratireducens]|uniref:DUF4276 family protein n=1 Tax=Dyella nitratireducens TaxID=1849580 RepID=A0ABQ1GUQ9_9GAMM|nr:hypothetical protein GCM10010981_44010 [Dyella nitratireducens]GLQ42516.1 hypothetical protein GCM10007902_23660 [Dyella nitratireducens]
MSRVYVLVEGQTEEAFVNELVMPYYARQGVYFTPIIVSTSPHHRGGVVSYAKIKPQIERLCKQDPGAHVTTLFDLYALPGNFPGKDDPAYQGMLNGQHKAAFLEMALAQDIGQRNFIPNLLVHEFEALLFVRIESFEAWTDDDRNLVPLREVRARVAPEDINDCPQTAPSKRILAAWPGYQKTAHGPLIACDIGLDAMRAACPHFDGWLRKIETLE